jgi:hypothetical protein
MSDVVYLRPIEPPVTVADVQQMAAHAGACFNLHRVDWVQSFLAAEGTRMLCWYQAPDAESVRIALRQLGSDVRAAWSARLIRATDEATDPFPAAAGNVVAEFRFDPPLEANAAALQGAIGADALAPHGVRFLGGFMSTSGQHAACIYRAADVGVVRTALLAAGASPAAVWTCVPLTPQAPATSPGGGEAVDEQPQPNSKPA